MNNNIRFVAIENNRIGEWNHSWLKIGNRQVNKSLTTLDSVTVQSPLCIIFSTVDTICDARTMIVTSKHKKHLQIHFPFPEQRNPCSISFNNASSSHTLRNKGNEKFPSGIRNLHIRSIATTLNIVCM